MALTFLENYGPFTTLVKDGYQKIKCKDLSNDNIDFYFYSLINILKDGIETEEVQSMMINVEFQDGIDVDLSIFDLVINLMFWNLNTSINKPINSIHLFFPENITTKEIKQYIDVMFLDIYRKDLPFITMNQTIDSCIGKFRELRPFQMYLANTLNMDDDIELMNKYKDYYDAIHFDIEGIPLSDVKDKGMEAANVLINRIKNSDHCLRDSFRTNQGVSPKQYKEVAVNIGTKPNGQGSIFAHPIDHSYMNGGLQSPRDLFIDSSVGRFAQILQKENVGESGAFSRNLELNNQDTRLHRDPDYVCDTEHFQEVFIDSATKLDMFDLRYYRENPKGVDKLLDYKSCKHLIGKKLYFRSPMTCASAARGAGICYKCYGDLAYVNKEINIGQIAAENLSAIYTQILLSAKHLLESMVIKMEWTPKFYELFNVQYNTIGLKENFLYKGWKLRIEEDFKTEEDIDEIAYNYYINSFYVISPQGEKFKIHTAESDNIYLTSDFREFINAKKNKYVKFIDSQEEETSTIIEIDMTGLMDILALFIVDVKNNELSKTMDSIKKLVNNKGEISKYDRNQILEKFIETNIAGGITLNSVHFEVLLMNQIRDADDELEMPDWSLSNPRYQMLTLDKSLADNRAIAIRLQINNIPSVLRNPQNDFLHKPAMIDLFYMKQPQEYLNEEIISDEYKPRSDRDEEIEQPITFSNPKIQVGRQSVKHQKRRD